MVQPFLSFGPHFTPLGPTRLEPPETKPHSSTTPPSGGTPAELAPHSLGDIEQMHLETSFRHSGWAPARHAIARSLRRVAPSLWRINSFQSCGSNAWIDRSDDDPTKYRIRCDRCHDRWCLPCGQERSRVIAHNVHERLNTRRARFITLTLRATFEPLSDRLDLLYSSFAKLRRSRVWANTQQGGVAFLELKISRNAQVWHPHLHILTEGKYIAKQALSNAWKKATDGSYIVDVKKVHNADTAVGYVVKYASKPHDATTIRTPDRLDEAVQALSGRRLCLTFGTWRGVKLTEVPDTGTWTPIGPLVDFLRQAAAGYVPAAEVLAALPRNVFPTECRAPPDEPQAQTETPF